MIFCTVGTQLPFDRLVDYLIRWQESSEYKDIIFQVGNSHQYLPTDGYQISISEPLFSEIFDKANVIVSHAGMGNIIRALDLNKAIIVVPRQASLGEHINDHQQDTTNSLIGLPNLFPANNYDQFCAAMEKAENYISVSVSNNKNLKQLLNSVSEFVAR